MPSETPEECVVREIWEESGLTIHNPVLRGILTFPAFDGVEDWYTFVFTASEFEGELIDSPEGVLDWVDDDQLLALNLWPGDRIFLPWLAGTAFFSGKFVYREGELVCHEVTFYECEGESVRGDARTVTRSISSVGAVGGGGAAQVIGEAIGAWDQRRFRPAYVPEDDRRCWVCDGPVVKRHCKIVCQCCGFTRDCSDP